ncbi:hypothetical protein [Hoeflea sp. EC-HK425]|uniref:hypothetical protein n=1 Tax=Hoeflea sp. EC-HK425 TaxID=2038388 RepID=UPI00125EA8EB|nr:hypothetical protein [Hoeflea sp. EC-HK425]|tara:strand:- start:2774 stop:2959 length:186 start_codon:yes stop_codon:yes gene_type:complete
MNQNETAELSDMFILQGIPAHIRSDNSQESMTKAHGGLDGASRFQDSLHHAGQPVVDEWLC